MGTEFFVILPLFAVPFCGRLRPAAFGYYSFFCRLSFSTPLPGAASDARFSRGG